MEVVTAGAQDELMQSLDYKLKTSNTNYVIPQLAELLLPRHLEGLPHSADQRHLVHRPQVNQDRLQSQKHGRHQPAGAGHSEPSLFHPEDPGLCQRPALRRQQLLRPHRGRA